ncbi:TIGR03364 family FAD-dependent oxidoreductase [Flavobacterium cellulosilyticum]|uniref:TIGR03364 family FAD-dependent oxidoreductase n=1 Tax=Flavobacterium cellulosilyticum TaxID=2541731 RepID=A0A4R5CA31_9FLAO|nr:TIGR03364 family FAD-dependent oxidoreductase [Flavobacterium cellulosilyticum]TDD95040.1 TIGR03364 family FAD-dependent oxidoreductase [Flavobacterium cellulosilyticum]
MKPMYDLIVVGSGVLGSFHAYHALKKGLRVALIEKDKMPKGATIQNFGQVVPSGMDTKWQAYGRESLAIYKEIQSQFDISIRQNGSVYLASNEEEVQLIEELSHINQSNNYQSHLLTKQQCLYKYSCLRSDYVKAGLFFPEEVTVEPRTMIYRLQEFMIQNMGLKLITNTSIINCESTPNGVSLSSAANEDFLASKVIICNGSEFKNLYPKLFNESDLEVSKLQMMQTKPQKNYVLPGSILTGLSIRRYEAFYECPSFKSIKAKEDPHSLEKKWGVHILFKQAADGSVILGDSHHYAEAKNIDDLGFDLDMDIDNFMIQEAKKIIDLPNYEIQNRWYGTYSQCKTKDIFEHTIDDNIHIITGIGGKGMTGSAGFSKENINKIFNRKE